MEKILRTKKLTTAFEAILLGLGLVIVLGTVYWLAPGLRVKDSVELTTTMEQDSSAVDNVANSPLLPLPSDKSKVRLSLKQLMPSNSKE